ncbi:hypothetical protein BKA65DRAFT_476018 [Rhexocercosporidium sp. MPI-PUGE-AT-0058]|nr:hypothetical protein BKA65DRAFT_476018 [Rhexocercosporidium sp. MPI-PUGE-AT-0058]
MTNPPLPLVGGYPKLASHMGRYSQSAIYRRFGSLNSQNILYMQAELIHLEKKLRALEVEDSASGAGHRPNYSKDWYWLNYASEEGSDQWETALKIRLVLKEYNDAIIQQSVMGHLSDPNSHDLRSLQQWLERLALGNLPLVGKDRDTWGTSDEPINPNNDLLTVSSLSGHRDSFSAWFTECFIFWLHKLFWYRVKKVDDPESGIASYEESVLHRYTSHITTIIASLLPVLAIVVLYCVDSMKARLGLIAFFTFMFTTALSFFTNASRGETFMATSAFAAVQVVFISTGNEGGSLGS